MTGDNGPAFADEVTFVTVTHPRVDENIPVIGPFPSRAAATAYVTEQIQCDAWEASVDVRYHWLEALKDNRFSELQVRLAPPTDGVEVRLLNAGLVTYDGSVPATNGSVLVVTDATVDSDAFITMTAVQRAVTIARLRAYADLLEGATTHV